MSDSQDKIGRVPEDRGGGDQDAGDWASGAGGADWAGGLSEAELVLQSNLSCLVDGELDEAAAARVMLQMEESPECRAFFEDARRYARLHRDMADPDRLEARLATLAGLPDGSVLTAEVEKVDLLHRLATIFYQLGKAYVLAGIDFDGFRERVFEAAVKVEDVQTQGRGFVDGVVLGGKASIGGVDWRGMRTLLEGRLERIEAPAEKGRRLLEQALEVDPSHDEAKIYLAFLYQHQAKPLKAAQLYQEVFTTAISPENRVHAANQLGRLHNAEQDWRRAIACWRWITMSGVADGDPRFWFVRLNIAISYAYAGDPARSLTYFRQLLDLYPAQAADVARVLAETPMLRTAIESRPGFPESLQERCPELFCGGQELQA